MWGFGVKFGVLPFLFSLAYIDNNQNEFPQIP